MIEESKEHIKMQTQIRSRDFEIIENIDEKTK